MFDVV